jgi:hypothetical protein
VKQVFLILLFFIGPVLLLAQQRDSTIGTKPDSALKVDTARTRIDSLGVPPIDSIKSSHDSVFKNRESAYIESISKIIKRNYYLNSTGKPVSMVNKVRSKPLQEKVFYVILVITAILAFFRFVYTRYFNNLFRVFFNASLRQSQLTDQLLQAKLPSLFFNLIFILIGGVYIYLLLSYYNWIASYNFWMIILYCTLSLAIVYIAKFMSLKFTGWVTGYKEVTNTYIFIIFLINKILGVLLLPFVIIIAFSIPSLITASVVISLLVISLMFLLRFFRSYGLLQNKLKISRFHFFMYVLGVEIIPLLLIYKALILLLSKNL